MEKFQNFEVIQVGALPFTVCTDVVMVALITSRRRGQWIIPKGWPENGLTLSMSAALEASQEVGCIGSVAEKPCGEYCYFKRSPSGPRKKIKVTVYPLEVSFQKLEWKERKQREFVWLPIAEAACRADKLGLRSLLNDLVSEPTLLTNGPFINPNGIGS